MPDRNRLAQEVQVITSISELVSSYEEIAVMRIQKIRASVLATREFREGLVRVFADVRASKHQEVVHMLNEQKKRRGKRKLLKGKKKEVTVLLSPQERLSGDLTNEIVVQFLKALDSNPTDVVIIGDMGRSVIEKIRPDLKFEFFEMPKVKDPISMIQEVIQELLDYEQMTIHYGRFVNLVDQIPAMTQMYAERDGGSDLEIKEEEKQEQFFLFEPSLEVVVQFFDKQILSMLFKQTVDESRLAQLGSRITAMEAASINIEKSLKKLVIQHRGVVKEIRNKKQKQALAGMSLWM